MYLTQHLLLNIYCHCLSYLHQPLVLKPDEIPLIDYIELVGLSLHGCYFQNFLSGLFFPSAGRRDTCSVLAITCWSPGWYTSSKSYRWRDNSILCNLRGADNDFLVMACGSFPHILSCRIYTDQTCGTQILLQGTPAPMPHNSSLPVS